MWTLAKFRPWHPVIRNRMPPSKHYLLKNVPPGINPSLIEQFLGGLYNRDAGDTYRFPSESSWDPRHGITIEPLEPKFSSDGLTVTVLPLAAGALSEVGTKTPNQDELSRTERLTPVAPGEVGHPEVVDRFSIDTFGFRSRNDQSTAKFDEEKASTRYLARMEHENVYRKTAFAQGHNNADSSVIHKDDLLKARKERAARVIAEAKREAIG
ncbi:hypothetical protein GEMRC1_005457 [Eukaryota sp. GEM-RC1]